MVKRAKDDNVFYGAATEVAMARAKANALRVDLGKTKVQSNFLCRFRGPGLYPRSDWSRGWVSGKYGKMEEIAHAAPDAGKSLTERQIIEAAIAKRLRKGEKFRSSALDM